MRLIDLMSKLKGALHKGGGIDSEIDRAFASQSQAPQNKPPPTVSERVLTSQQRFNQQFQSAAQRRPELIQKESSGKVDFGRFDENFVSDKHLDNFDETKNIEDFSRVKPPELPPPLRREVPPEPRDELHELATATPHRNLSNAERIIEELEDVRAQNSEILRRLQRIEEKLRRQ